MSSGSAYKVRPEDLDNLNGRDREGGQRDEEDDNEARDHIRVSVERSASMTAKADRILGRLQDMVCNQTAQWRLGSRDSCQLHIALPHWRRSRRNLTTA